jgi:hypothetical protein
MKLNANYKYYGNLSEVMMENFFSLPTPMELHIRLSSCLPVQAFLHGLPYLFSKLIVILPMTPSLPLALALIPALIPADLDELISGWPLTACTFNVCSNKATL